MSFCSLDGPGEVELAWLQDEAFGGNDVPPVAIRPLHIEHDFFVDQQFVVQAEVVAVGVEEAFVERLNDNIVAELHLISSPVRIMGNGYSHQRGVAGAAPSDSHYEPDSGDATQNVLRVES